MRLENSRWGISMAKIMPRTMATATTRHAAAALMAGDLLQATSSTPRQAI